MHHPIIQAFILSCICFLLTNAQTDQTNHAKLKPAYGTCASPKNLVDGKTQTSIRLRREYLTFVIVDLNATYNVSSIVLTADSEGRYLNKTFTVSTWDKYTPICDTELHYPWHTCKADGVFTKAGERLEIECPPGAMTAQYVIISVGQPNATKIVDNRPTMAELEVYGEKIASAFVPPSFETDPPAVFAGEALRTRLLKGQDSVEVERLSSGILIHEKDDVPLWWCNNDNIYAVATKRGKGRLILLGAPHMAANLISATYYKNLRNNVFTWLRNGSTGTARVVEPNAAQINPGDILNIRMYDTFDVDDIYKRIISGQNPAIISKSGNSLYVLEKAFTKLVDKLYVTFKNTYHTYPNTVWVRLSNLAWRKDFIPFGAKLAMCLQSWQELKKEYVVPRLYNQIIDPKLASYMKRPHIQKLLQKILKRYEPYFDHYAPCDLKPTYIPDGDRIAWENYNYLLTLQFGNEVKRAAGVIRFPGDIRPGYKPSTVTVTVKTSAYDLFVPTSAYAKPGQPFTWRITKGKLRDPTNSRIRIGCHTDNLELNNPLKRWSAITNVMQLTNEGTYGSPIGGYLYLMLPANTEITVEFRDIYRTPWFDLRDPKSIENWDQEKTKYVGAPWMHISGDAMDACLQLDAVVQLNSQNLTFVINHYDKVTKMMRNFRGFKWDNEQSEMMAVDIQILTGYGHNGYPFMGTLPDWQKAYLDFNSWTKTGITGIIHELGHNMQPFPITLKNGGEVTNNIFIPVVNSRLLNISYYNFGDHYCMRENQLNEFIRVWNNESWDGVNTNYYCYIAHYFNDDAIANVLLTYKENNINPISEDEKAKMWVYELSRQTGYNLVPMHRLWHFPLMDEIENKLSNLPCFMPKDNLTKQVEEKITKLLENYPNCTRDEPNKSIYRGDLYAGLNEKRPPFVFVS